MRGGVLGCAAQVIPPIDAEIAEKGHLWTETRYGTAGLALAVLIFGITLIGSRNSQEPLCQGFLGCKHLPIIVGLAVLGAGSFIKFILSIGSQSLGFMELALVIGTIAVSLLLLKLLRIKQHLAEYYKRRVKDHTDK